MDDLDTPMLEKLRLLWSTPNAEELLLEWNLMKQTDWKSYRIFCEGFAL